TAVGAGGTPVPAGPPLGRGSRGGAGGSCVPPPVGRGCPWGRFPPSRPAVPTVTSWRGSWPRSPKDSIPPICRMPSNYSPPLRRCVGRLDTRSAESFLEDRGHERPARYLRPIRPPRPFAVALGDT